MSSGTTITMRCAVVAASCLSLAGCLLPGREVEQAVGRVAFSDVPRELDMVTHPAYRVAAPDILLLELVRNIRPPGERLEPGDQLVVRLANPEPIEPVDPDLHPIEAQYRLQLESEFKILNGPFPILPDGTLNLGPIYGSVEVAGLTLEQAQEAITQHLQTYARDAQGLPVGLRSPQVSVVWPDLAGEQAITGEHLVRPDGTISLGIYGSVYVAGMSLDEVRMAVESHLAPYISQPRVNVDVLAYNSRVYYVITDGGGYGEQVVRLPCTGNETVIDAIANIQGLSQVSSKRIWIARPAPAGTGCGQILDVHWQAIAAEGITDTNYQILPGDRIYVQADHFVAFDNTIAKITSPFERIFGFVLLGHGTVRALQFGHRGSQFGSGGFPGTGF